MFNLSDIGKIESTLSENDISYLQKNIFNLHCLGVSIQDVLKEVEKGMDLVSAVKKKTEEKFFQFKEYAEKLAQKINRISEEHHRIYKKNHKNIKKLADKCWFFPFLMFSFRQQPELLNVFGDGSIDELETDLEAFFESKQQEIEEYIINEYPSVEKLCSEVFEAHYNKKYYLSVPMFFTLTDSIASLSNVGVPYFFQDEFCSKLKELRRESSSNYRNNFYKLLVQDLYIRLQKNARQNHELSNSLNRHVVIHGLLNEYDWGNKTDSFKAMSLAYFIASLFNTETQSEK